MNLLGTRPKRDATQDVAQSSCVATCAGLDETEHTRHHLLMDFAKASEEANKHGRITNTRFAIFEQGCAKTLHDELRRCSHQESAASLISSVDVSGVMQIIHELIDECRGVHLSYVRDIYTERPSSAYIIYEIRVEPGFQLPSK